MNVTRISRKDLRALKVGEVGVFTLPDAKAVEVGKVQAAMVKRLDDYEFERIKSADSLTLIYKRIK